MEVYACESGLLRAQKKAKRDGQDAAAPMRDMVALYTHDAMDRVAVWGRNILAAVAAGDELRTMTSRLRRLAKHDPVDRAKLHDAIAERIVEADVHLEPGVHRHSQDEHRGERTQEDQALADAAEVQVAATRHEEREYEGGKSGSAARLSQRFSSLPRQPRDKTGHGNGAVRGPSSHVDPPRRAS